MFGLATSDVAEDPGDATTDGSVEAWLGEWPDAAGVVAHPADATSTSAASHFFMVIRL